MASWACTLKCYIVANYDFKGYKVLLDETSIMGHKKDLDVGSMLIIKGDSRGYFPDQMRL